MIYDITCAVLGLLLMAKIGWNLALPILMLSELKREPNRVQKSESWMPGVEVSLLSVLTLLAWWSDLKVWGFEWPWIGGVGFLSMILSWVMMPVIGAIAGRVIFRRPADDPGKGPARQ